MVGWRMGRRKVRRRRRRNTITITTMRTTMRRRNRTTTTMRRRTTIRIRRRRIHNEKQIREREDACSYQKTTQRVIGSTKVKESYRVESRAESELISHVNKREYLRRRGNIPSGKPSLPADHHQDHSMPSCSTHLTWQS